MRPIGDLLAEGWTSSLIDIDGFHPSWRPPDQDADNAMIEATAIAAGPPCLAKHGLIN
ncbi:MAG: hypothetical protein WA892_02030 [Ornithinimicrobium sp.]